MRYVNTAGIDLNTAQEQAAFAFEQARDKGVNQEILDVHKAAATEAYIELITAELDHGKPDGRYRYSSPRPWNPDDHLSGWGNAV